MSESHHQRDLLVRYLLGAASASERDAVEDECFANETGVSVLLRAEDELIDDYVRGVLSDSDRRLFESHFLCTEGRRQRLEMVKSFVNVLGQMELVELEVSSDRPKHSLPLQDPAGSTQPSPAGFVQLLNWLDSDFQRAGEKFEKIRQRLIEIFTRRGFNNAEELADATVDNVAARAGQLLETYIGDPAAYFYAVASKIMVAAARAKAPVSLAAGIIEKADISNQENACLEKCLKQLSETNRDLILQYYLFDRKTRIENRKVLSQNLGIPASVLRLRVHRIRQALETCVKTCLQHQNDRVDNPEQVD